MGSSGLHHCGSIGATLTIRRKADAADILKEKAMKLPKKQAAVVRAALEEWRASGLLDEETGKRLLDDLTPLPFDWYRLGRYALWSALTCILIGVAALLGDELFLDSSSAFSS